MLQRSAGLSRTALDAIADLERRVVAADGGRLKLEWSLLRSRPPAEVNDVLWWDGDRLLGFAGRYAYGGAEPEIAGMVDPSARRRGIGAGLLDAMLTVNRERGAARVMVIVPRPSAAGAALARRFGGELDHSEHALSLPGEPAPGSSSPSLMLRDATADDADAVEEILSSAFDWVPDDVRAMLAGNSRKERTLVVDEAGRPVATLRIDHDVRDGRDVGSIYGFAVLASEQGRGIGRDVLRRACELLRAEGSERVTLEVAVENDRALGLYTGTGFEPVTTEDYYAVSTAARVSA